jgi:hypothetical protein
MLGQHAIIVARRDLPPDKPGGQAKQYDGAWK